MAELSRELFGIQKRHKGRRDTYIMTMTGIETTHQRNVWLRVVGT
jgi:hypothetical protein